MPCRSELYIMLDLDGWPMLPQPASTTPEAPQSEQQAIDAAPGLTSLAIVTPPSPDGQWRLSAADCARPLAASDSTQCPAIITPLPNADEQAQLRAKIAQCRAEAARNRSGGPLEDAARRDAPARPAPVPPCFPCSCTQCKIMLSANLPSVT